MQKKMLKETVTKSVKKDAKDIEFWDGFDSENIKLPLLALKDLSPFPTMISPIFVGREKSVKAVDYANTLNGKIFLVAQKESALEEFELEDLEVYGVIAEVKQVVLLQDRTLKVLVECTQAARLVGIVDSEMCGVEASVVPLEFSKNVESEEERLALQNTLKYEFEKYLKITKNFDSGSFVFLSDLTESYSIAYYVAERLHLTAKEKQEVLIIQSEKELLEYLSVKVGYLIRIVELERKIKNRLKNQVEQNQKEYYLNEQIKAIQKELGDTGDYKEELAALEDKIKNGKMSEHAKDTALSEFKKLKYMNQFSSEFSVIKNYLDFLVDLPWGVYTDSNKDLKEIRRVLESSHFGMKDIKDRVYELIVPSNRVDNNKKATVLCFHGAPGIGKTSFAFAIGKAMGLKTVSIPLGGVKDESVLRGHRRTYIGSMPGKIIQAIKDAGTSNLVIVLDEIGSMGSDWRGNPEDVLLEVLDPMQNQNFQDNYLGTGFDLSGVIFVATTNSIDNIKPALLDRLEVISLSGYTQEEKHKIARHYIVPKILEEHGIKVEQFILSDEVLNHVIRYYTYESGVRGLEKQLSKLARKVMCIIEEGNTPELSISLEDVKKFLKKPVYVPDSKKEPRLGVVNGLAYVGSREGQEGEVLTIEAVLVPGDGKVEFTGNLGSMMKESLQIAYKKILANADVYGVDVESLKSKNVYVNFPSGGTPKDGPSAGVAIFCAMYSAILGVPIPNDIAMTGEISLFDALRVGGIKEKLLAAYRHGIKKVFLPFDNEIDLSDLSKDVLKDMQVFLIKKPDEVLANIGVLGFDSKGVLFIPENENSKD